MWKRIVEQAQELIKSVDGMKSMTAAEKKAFVIKGLCNAIDLPLIPDWIENLIEPVLYGYVVDIIVKWWNAFTGHRLESLPANVETAAAMAEVVIKEIKSIASGEAVDASDVNARFDALIAKYGVADGGTA